MISVNQEPKQKMNAKNVDAGEGFRLLKRGEKVLKGDEYLDDGMTWLEVGVMAGHVVTGHESDPFRRRIGRVSKSRPRTFFSGDFPNMATHCNQAECGFSIYRGVLVQWDEDHDERVFRIMDEMPCSVVDELLIVQEHKCSVVFKWKAFVPVGYEEDEQIIFDGDVFYICESIPVQTPMPRSDRD